MDEMKLIVNERIFGIFLIEESTNSFVNFFFFIIDQISFCCRFVGSSLIQLFNYAFYSYLRKERQGRERVAFDRISRHRISRI